MKFIKYLSYMLRHKWFVMIECFKLGLYWQGLVHDLSKFRLDEFIPYVNYFYGKKQIIRDKTGYYKPTDTGDDAFDFAWLLHQKRNRHHWQWWILLEDSGAIKILPMPKKYILEMIYDWKGAGKAQRNDTPVREWYLKNKNKMQLHKETEKILEELLIKEIKKK